MPIVQVTTFKFKRDTKPMMMQHVLQQFGKLGIGAGGPASGIIFFSVLPGHVASDFDMQQVTIFHDEAAQHDYKNHPAHVEMVELLKQHCDWTHQCRGAHF